MPVDFWRNDAHSGEKKSRLGASTNQAAHIRDEPRVRIKLDAAFSSRGAQRERGDIAGSAVRADQRAQWKVREHIAIINKERFIAEKVGRIFDAASGFEENGFVAEKNFTPPVVATPVRSAQQAFVGLGAMVCIDDKFLHSGL